MLSAKGTICEIPVMDRCVGLMALFLKDNRSLFCILAVTAGKSPQYTIFFLIFTVQAFEGHIKNAVDFCVQMTSA